MQLAPLFPVLHQILRPAFPGCLWVGEKSRPEIALTFDDGPHPQHTPQLLEVLDHYGIPASFFGWGLVSNGHRTLLEQFINGAIGLACTAMITSPFPYSVLSSFGRAWKRLERQLPKPAT